MSIDNLPPAVRAVARWIHPLYLACDLGYIAWLCVVAMLDNPGWPVVAVVLPVIMARFGVDIWLRGQYERIIPYSATLIWLAWVGLACLLMFVAVRPQLWFAAILMSVQWVRRLVLFGPVPYRRR
jgi:hypothetical protein